MPSKTEESVRDVRVAAHTIVLPRGKFCVSVAEVTPGIPAPLLPGLSVSVIPGDGSDVAIVGFGDSPWLREPGDAVLLHVRSPEARILLTSYNLLALEEAQPPRMQVQRLGSQPVAAQPRPVAPQAVAPTQILAHIARVGDRSGAFGEWLGEGGPGCWIEGIQILPPEGIVPEEIEYQVVLGKGWTSPWSAGGEFCGSRGMTLPVQGLRVALRGRAAERFEVRVEARTADGTLHGPAGSDELCGPEEPEPLAMLRVTFAPRAPEAAPARRRTRRAG